MGSDEKEKAIFPVILCHYQHWWNGLQASQDKDKVRYLTMHIDLNFRNRFEVEGNVVVTCCFLAACRMKGKLHTTPLG